MNCDQFANLLASGATLPAEAREHLHACATCSRLAAIEDQTEAPAIDLDAENRIIAAITTGLTAVNPLAAAWWYVLGAVSAATAVAAAGILMLGAAGWAADSGLQRTYSVACLGAGILFSVTTVAQLMTPGAFLLLTPRRTIALAIVCTVAGTMLYPAAYYDGFIRAIVACVSIGLGHAAAACALTFFVVRRGAFIWRPEMAAMVVLAGGLTGMAVLYVFCPHRDLGHFILGHTIVPMVIAAWIGGKISR